MNETFLPVSMKDMQEAGIEQLDFVYISGDAYVDHPSFGTAIISRLLVQHGYTVGVIAQPDWKDEGSIAILGEPRLGFLVSAGNMDSMVNHYTVSKKPRHLDAYSPGGKNGLRPDRAVTVYGNLIRKTYKHTPVIIGGIEASLRRLAHYDYWSDRIKRSVLLDSGADMISYGMGEHSILEIAQALDAGIAISDITYIAGTVFRSKDLDGLYQPVILPSFEEVKSSKEAYAKSFYSQYQNTDAVSGRVLAEDYGNQGYIVQNPPAKPLSTDEMDDIYAMPYTKTYHPMYNNQGGVPAITEVQFSLTSNRGCFGGCNFCALTFHQGRTIQVRSHDSLLKEAAAFSESTDFKGYIHDVGGPTADFRAPSCEKQLTKGVCSDRQCLFPKPCKNLEVSHQDYVSLLRKLRKLPGVKKVFVRSGLRFDYVLADRDNTFLKELVEHHISGQLRVAPEHVSDSVLMRMGKPEHSVYEAFLKKYNNYNQKVGKKQYAVPYFMSSHPGCGLKEAIALAEYIRDMNFTPEQVQDFYPTPSTISTCMYYTGLDPATLEPVYVAGNPHEKAMQRALIQFRVPGNYTLVHEALTKAGRTDLIGFDPKCLIRPRQLKKDSESGSPRTGKSQSVKNRTQSKKLPADKMKTQKKKTIRNVHKKKR